MAVTPELLDYIRTQLSAHYAREDITLALSKEGWLIDDINEGFTRVLKDSQQERLQPTTQNPLPVNSSTLYTMDANTPQNVTAVEKPAETVVQSVQDKKTLPTIKVEPAANQAVITEDQSLSPSPPQESTPVQQPTQIKQPQQMPTMAPVDTTPVVAGTATKKRHHGGIIAVIILLLIVIAGVGYAYAQKIGPFNHVPYTSDNLLPGIFGKVAKITSSNTTLAMDFAFGPRDSDAVPFSAPNNLEETQAFSSYFDGMDDAVATDATSSLVFSFQGNYVATSSDWQSAFEGNFDSNDESFDIGFNALKAGDMYYVEVTHLPDIIAGFLPIQKNQWISFNPDTLNSSSTADSLEDVGISTSTISNSYAERAKYLTFLKAVASDVMSNNLITVGEPTKISQDGATVYEYPLTINEAAIAPFYESIVSDAKADLDPSVAESIDSQSTLRYLQSADFANIVNYIEANSSMVLTVDSSGEPLSLTSKLRIVPPDSATAFAGKQGNLTTSLTLSEVNEPVMVTAPASSTPLETLLNNFEEGFDDDTDSGSSTVNASNNMPN